MRRAQHGQPPREPAIEQLARNHRRLDGFADTDIVGDQQPYRRLPQRHDQGDELVRPGHHRNAAERAERPRAGAQAQARRIEQGHDAGRVAAGGGFGISESRQADALTFEGQKETDLLSLRRRQRP